MKKIAFVVSIFVLSFVLSNTALAVIDGGGTTGRIPKFTAPTVIGDSIITEKDGKIGIGTANPQEVLDVVGGSFFRGNSSRSMFLAKQNGTGDVATFMQGNSYKLIIKNNGNVGIGTDSPGALLHISGVSTVGSGKFAVLRVEDTTANWSRLALKTLNNEFLLQTEDSAGDWFGIVQEGGTNPGYKFTVMKDTGNVGIGTTAPLFKLDIKGQLYAEKDVAGGTRGVVVDSDGTNARVVAYSTGAASRPPLVFWANEAERMRITTDGNVGIGTTNPGYKLDVNGDVRWSGTLQGGAVPWARISGFPGDLTPDTIADDGQISDAEASDILTINNGLLFAPTSGNVGIGTANPGAKLTVSGPMIRRIARRQGYLNDGTDNGPIAFRTLNFTKTQNDTGIRVLWSDNFGVWGNSASCRWEIKFNDSSCTDPGGLYVNKYQDSRDAAASDDHEPATMTGTCENLPAGTYTIQGYVSQYNSSGNCYTGLESMFSMEAEEVY